MTIVKTEAGDGFVQNPPDGIVFFLIHGNDVGLIHERASRLAKSLSKGDLTSLGLVRLDGESLAREPGLLYEQANTGDMFGGYRVIWIEAGQRDLSKALAILFETRLAACSVIVEAGALKKGASFRVMFEQARQAASVECYPDQRRALETLIDSLAGEAGAKITPDARSYLISLLGSDRLASRNEVSKLLLFGEGLPQIDVGEVEAIVSDAAPSGVESVIDAAFSGNIKEVESLGARYFHEAGDANVLISKLIARLDLLHQLKLNSSSDFSVNMSAPAVLYRLPAHQRAKISEHAAKWSASALQRRHLWAQNILAQVRKRPHVAELTAIRALWALASHLRVR